MQARIKWVEDASFLGITDSNHAVLMDGPPEAGGTNLGPRPMEMLLLGAGGCTAFDVVAILKKGRQQSPSARCKSRQSAPTPTPRYSPGCISISRSRKRCKAGTSGKCRKTVRRKILLGHRSCWARQQR